MGIVQKISLVIALALPTASHAAGDQASALERAVRAGSLNISSDNRGVISKTEQVVGVEIRSCIVAFKTKMIENGFTARVADFHSNVSLKIEGNGASVSLNDQGQELAISLFSDGGIRPIYDQLALLSHSCRQPTQLF